MNPLTIVILTLRHEGEESRSSRTKLVWEVSVLTLDLTKSPLTEYYSYYSTTFVQPGQYLI